MAVQQTSAVLGATLPGTTNPDMTNANDTMALLVAAFQALEAVTHSIFADTGSANALAIALTAGVAINAGLTIRVKVKAANTGATTIAVNGGSAVAVQKHGAALAGAELAANMIAELAFDGTHWQVVGL